MQLLQTRVQEEQEQEYTYLRLENHNLALTKQRLVNHQEPYQIFHKAHFQ